MGRNSPISTPRAARERDEEPLLVIWSKKGRPGCRHRGATTRQVAIAISTGRDIRDEQADLVAPPTGDEAQFRRRARREATHLNLPVNLQEVLQARPER